MMGMRAGGGRKTKTLRNGKDQILEKPSEKAKVFALHFDGNGLAAEGF